MEAGDRLAVFIVAWVECGCVVTTVVVTGTGLWVCSHVSSEGATVLEFDIFENPGDMGLGHTITNIKSRIWPPMRIWQCAYDSPIF